jgi:hydroxyethylthiazole kinase-like uncharacterized protein yjeF
VSTRKTGDVGRVWLPRRNPAGHKGTFGTVSVIGGCCAGDVRMLGAPALAAAAALRAGCGLARLVMPERLVEAGLGLVPSATGRAMAVDKGGAVRASGAAGAVRSAMAESDAVVLGPGMGVSKGTVAAVRAALAGLASSRCTLVLDADGLNALATGRAGTVPGTDGQGQGVWGPRGAGGLVLTPHPGEFARLATKLGLEADAIEPARRSAAAQSMAKRMRAVVVLKGARTVVADPERVWVSEAADPALATAGTGDVLAGLIGGLLAATWTARGFFGLAAPAAPTPAEFWPGTGSGPEQAAKYAAEALRLRREVGTVDTFGVCVVAVRAHAAAAAAWRKRERASAGLMAMELAAELPAALQRFRKR